MASRYPKAGSLGEKFIHSSRDYSGRREGVPVLAEQVLTCRRVKPFVGRAFSGVEAKIFSYGLWHRSLIFGEGCSNPHPHFRIDENEVVEHHSDGMWQGRLG